MRYALEVQYRGKCYAGSQIQFENGKQITEPTIQGELEKALSTLTKQKLKTFFSGRTDAGVHAKEQFVHFDTELDINESKFINSLNGLLPKDISIREIFKKNKEEPYMVPH